jgi:hypothetical protein
MKMTPEQFKDAILNGQTKFDEPIQLTGPLDLRGCTGITALPDGLTVTDSLYLQGCTGIKNVVFMSKKCGDHLRKQAVAQVNGEPKISLGCFLGNQRTAVKAIRKKYGNNSEYEATVVEAFDRFNAMHSEVHDG